VKKILPIYFIFAMLFNSCAGNKLEMENIVFDHYQRHKNMEVQDFYKLVYQASMGVTHYISSPENARKYLEWEITILDSAENVQMVEPLSPDGKLVRVNLRPYVKHGGNVDNLFEAMMKSSEKIQPSTENLEIYWQCIINMADKKLIPFDRKVLTDFFNEMKDMNFPAVHHSDGYAQLNRPAYRVILKEFLPEIQGK